MTALGAVRPLIDALCARPGSCEGCEARRTGVCASLAPDILAEVSDAGERVVFAPREAIFRQGERASQIYILHNGTARLTKLLPDGRQASVGFRFGGDAVGLSPEAEHHLGAEALTELVACRINQDDLSNLFQRHPALQSRLMQLCTRELATTQEQLVALARFSAEERVAAFLLSLAEARDRRGHPGPVYDLAATRADIGELLGLTLETVSRTLSKFRRRGWTRPAGSHAVELLDRKALAHSAFGHAPPCP
ncbi:MAG: Crp/Fnr family transcriptional regulator [Pseudomonadota bacterium]